MAEAQCSGSSYIAGRRNCTCAPPKIMIAMANSVTRRAYGASPMTSRALRTAAICAMAAIVAAIAQEMTVKSTPAKRGQISSGKRNNAGNTPK